MANVIAGLAAQLGLDTTEFKKGIAEAKTSLKEFKEMLPEVLSAAAFYELIHASMELANQVVATAKANDVSTESVLRLSKALEENGGNAEDVSRIYSGFTQKIEAAVQGNATAQTSFAKLGVTLNDLAHLSEEDLFAKTVSGLANMKDAAERNGLAFQTLGRAIRGVDLKGLAASLEENKGVFDKYAQSMEMAHELSLKLEASHKKLAMQLTDAIIPSLNVLYDSFTNDGHAMEFVMKVVQNMTVAVVGSIAVVKTWAGQLKDVFVDFWEGYKKLFSGQGSFKEIGQNVMKDLFNSDRAKELADIFDKLDKANAPIVEHTKKQEDAARNVTKEFAKQLLAAESLSAAYEKQADLALLTLRHKEDAMNMTKHEKEVQDEVNKVIEARDKQLAAIAQKIDQLDMTKLGSDEIKKALEEQSMQITIMADKYKQDTAKVVKANQEFRESFDFGWNQAFMQFKENAMTAADYGKEAFNTMTNAMDNALSNFVKTGKLNFRSLAQSIIQDLLTIQLKMQANQLFSSAFGSIMPGLNAAMYAAKTSTGPGFTNDMGGFEVAGSLGFADGGDPPVGKASIVGERGPELFVPKTAGTIIPNNQLGNIGGSTTNVTNYNIQAIDTKSFEERLYGSANAIWAANTYAQKNLAVNRSRT